MRNIHLILNHNVPRTQGGELNCFLLVPPRPVEMRTAISERQMLTAATMEASKLCTYFAFKKISMSETGGGDAVMQCR